MLLLFALNVIIGNLFQFTKFSRGFKNSLFSHLQCEIEMIISLFSWHNNDTKTSENYSQ